MNLEIDQIKKILKTTLKGNDFAEIYYEKTNLTSMGLSDSKLEDISNGIIEGVGLRIIKGENTIYGHTNDVTFDGILKLSIKLNIINEKKECKKNIPKFVYEVGKNDAKTQYSNVSIENKIALLKEGDKYARSITSKEIVQFSAGYSDVEKDIIIINSNGRYITDKVSRAVLRYSIILKDGENVQTGYASTGTSKGFEHFENEIYKELVKEAVRSGEVMLTAQPSISGKMDVIIAGKAGGTMIHEACGHGLELDLVQDEISIYKDMLGKKVANEKVSVIDSGVIPGLYGTSKYDGEGNKTEESVLIENGILKKFMNSYLTAEKEKISYTGNGRRQNYKNIPIPRMRNTYIKPGSDKIEDMLKTIDRGVYVSKMGGGQVDTVTGDFVFSAVESYLIENGEIKHPLKNITLTGNGKDVLQNIQAVSDDLNFIIGTCGKSGQGVPVTTGQPTIMIKDIIVGGMK